MNDVTILEELILFIRTYLREYTMPITRDTRVEDDLAVTGDEAAEFIWAFGKRFCIDISQFPFSDFFHDEPNGFNFKTRPVKSFTIAHLEQALLSGVLTGSQNH